MPDIDCSRDFSITVDMARSTSSASVDAYQLSFPDKVSHKRIGDTVFGL